MDTLLLSHRPEHAKVEKTPTRVVTDYDLQALVDNELSDTDRCRIEAHIARDANAQRRYADLSAQKKLLKKWWAQSRS